MGYQLFFVTNITKIWKDINILGSLVLFESEENGVRRKGCFA